MHKRNCPQCGVEIGYKRKDNYLAAVRDNNWCKACSALPAQRKCPACGQGITYTNRQNCIKAEKKNQTCKGCATSNRRSYQGEGNPFYGQKHTSENVDRMKHKDMSFTQTEAFRQRRRETSYCGQDNPMYGTSVYEFWVKKHGKKKADELFAEAKAKWSAASSGENNPMFGKPAPMGSGYGWKGWYKGWFFRSLRELAYVINVLETEGKSWQSAETKELSIPYLDWAGNPRTYRADFLVDDKYLIEVKPERLRSSRTVRLKEEAAIVFCEANGLEYQIVDPPKLTDEEILELHQSKSIKFLEQYEKRFKEEYYD